MRKFLNLTLFVFLGIALASCLEDSLSNNATKKTQSVVDTKVAIDEALENAEKMLSEFEGNTRSERRRVESIEIVSLFKHTRSSSTDSLLYVVNYADNAGFALLGTDKRMKEVYAISPQGHLSLNDTVKDEMFRMFINSAIEDAQNSLNTFNLPAFPDSVSLTFPTYIITKNRVITSVDIPDYIANLFAGTNFVESTKEVNCTSTAVSLSKIMFILYTYHRTNGPDEDWANYHDELIRNYNWNTLQNMVQYMQARLDQSAGVVDCLRQLHVYIPGFGDSSYVTNVTGCNCKSYWGLRAQVHINQIRNLLTGSDLHKQGMMMTGKDEINNTSPSFVLDGLMTRDKYVYRQLDNKLLEGPIPEIWMHCLWSNIGNSNGYFLYNRNDDLLNISKEGLPSLHTLFIWGGLEQDATSGSH